METAKVVGNITESLKKLLLEDSCRRYVSFEYLTDGTVRAVVVLQTGMNVGPVFECSQGNQPLDNRQCGSILEEHASLHLQGNIDDKTDIENQIEDLRYCLVEALAMTLPDENNKPLTKDGFEKLIKKASQPSRKSPKQPDSKESQT